MSLLPVGMAFMRRWEEAKGTFRLERCKTTRGDLAEFGLIAELFEQLMAGDEGAVPAPKAKCDYRSIDLRHPLDTP